MARPNRRGGGGGSGGGGGRCRCLLPVALVWILAAPALFMWRMRRSDSDEGSHLSSADGRLHSHRLRMSHHMDEGIQEYTSSGLAGASEVGAASPVKEDRDGNDDGAKWASVGGPGDIGYPDGEDDIHVVFSTDCTAYQGWQAIVLFHSAVLAGHMGSITQLVSGCTEEEQRQMRENHELSKHAANHALFFTPNFAVDNPATGEPYPYLNKPNAMQLWLDQVEISETIVALIDPDFLFLKPLTTFMKPDETVARGDGLSLEGLGLEKGGWIRKGHPAGQRFSLPNWTQWDRRKICPQGSGCTAATTSIAKRFYDLIPPYLAHIDDWRTIVPVWVTQAPKVFAEYPSLLAEQTAYATASATLGLKHYRINNLAIENEKVDYELWDAIDHNVDNVCEVGIKAADNTSVNVRSYARMPTFIHYCHMYRVGQWLFNKRRYRKLKNYDQLACSTPLLETPPADIQTHHFKMHPGPRWEQITARAAKRNAFVLCVATRFVNSAFRRYKQKVCLNTQANFEESLRIA